ncbi:MAG: IS3 family transposase [Streptomyces sp.]|nr:IS3 family transposase [Streptomyces sp.]
MKTRRWYFISANRADFGVQRICRVLQVSRPGYYQWLAGAKARTVRQAAEDALVAEIREVHTAHKGTYGVRRVHAELRGFGHAVNRKRVERLMRLNRIEGRHLRRRKRTTVPDRLAPPAPDLVQRDFSAGKVDEKWCGESRSDGSPGCLCWSSTLTTTSTTDEATYRANLETLVAGVREKGGRPVLVTPIVRRWFNADGTLNNDIALLVNGLGVNHPEVIRSVAAAEDVPLIDLTAKTKALVESLGVEGSKALYLYDEKKDNTHTSAYGATVYAGLVRDELLAQHLVPRGTVRAG